ncbi:glycosyltransferase [Saccharothrix sp. S26]|uniref:glycosyltransferase n=1 Tax=Saccharothrix sp. S26 TaxID=2907215 RepID=UPI001F3FBC8F|nr:glycosyltransferase [Saccharothrix sp. S26]MCE6995230.1 glycosyltransferase [Saccharothrix sp. S26]
MNSPVVSARFADPVEPDVFLTRDPRAGDRRTLAVLSRHSEGTAVQTGAEMRQSALVDALRRTGPVDVLSINALRAAVSCARRCPPCAAMLMTTPEGTLPVPHNWYYCRRTADQVRQFLDAHPYPVVVTSHIWLSQYLPAIRAAGTARLVVDLHNAEADLQDELSAHPWWPRLRDPEVPEQVGVRFVEAGMVAAADVVTVPSEADRERLRRRYAPTAPIVVLPNAVPVAAGSRPVVARRPVSCFFLGALDYFPNTLAALEIVTGIGPAIAAAAPGLPVVVAGRRPVPVLAEAAAGGVVDLVADPPDAEPFFTGSLLIVPLRNGGGTRLKILQAFAAGCPVVSTAKGMEGIDALDGVHYLAAETSGEFAAAVAAVLADPASDLRRRQAAWDLVRSRYSRDALADLVVSTAELSAVER